MAILVTGGTGYIGSHMVVELLKLTEEVVILDNLSNSEENVIERIKEITGVAPKLVVGDIRDTNIFDSIFTTYQIDSVIHFAGLKAVGESVEKPLEYFDNNVNGTIVLLKAMKKYSCKKIVFSSSATVYGLSQDVPFKEDSPLAVTNPYGRTKLMIEDMLRDLYVSDRDFSVAILRYFNPIGAHESGLIGENPKGIPNNLLPYIVKVANRELDQLSVFGNDYDTIDGTGVRDYIHVVDLAKGHLKALEYVRKNTNVDEFNLGTGTGYSVLQVVHNFENVNNRSVPYIIKERRPGDIGTSYADATKSKEILNWTAKFDLEQMLKDSWNFVKRTKK